MQVEIQESGPNDGLKAQTDGSGEVVLQHREERDGKWYIVTTRYRNSGKRGFSGFWLFTPYDTEVKKAP